MTQRDTHGVDSEVAKLSQYALVRAWEPRLFDLSCRLRRSSRRAIREAQAQGDLRALSTPVGQGVGDVTFGLDEACERELTGWLLEQARLGPVSVLTEDLGWRHVGPGDTSDSGPVELAGFDHGGPRIVVDPVDGTRHLAFDMRSAWTVIGLAGPGEDAPHMSELILGEVSELPDSRAAHYRRLWATAGGGCRFELRALGDDLVLRESALVADDDDRVDHAYMPFFAYHPETRPEIDRIAADFFRRLAVSENADIAHCYDDQYIASGGQLALLAMGTYRMIVDPRADLAARSGRPTQTAHPYDLAGAVLCAREAGCIVTTLEGSTLDFELDATSNVGFVGFANAQTGGRLLPYLMAALDQLS
jgi:fructose-1,6-bisphosphatase/inositol monophosphatase family enzyme